MNKTRLSVVYATLNEEENIGRSIKSVKKIVVDEIIVVDEHSTDKTRDIARKLGAKVYKEPHHDIFHITKQKALDYATGDWILQLDADEVVTPKLAQEIKQIISPDGVRDGLLGGDKKKVKLFKKHQELLEKRDGKIGTDAGEVVGYFVPRINMFLGKPLRHAGVYPDGVIRFFKNGHAKFPCKSVHEQIEIDGKVGWLSEDLLHFDSPTLSRYFHRMNRYTDLKAQELNEDKVPKNIISFYLYTIYYPLITFLKLYFRHLGFLDGVNGFLWSLFSSWHFPIAYFKYITNVYNVKNE